MNSIGSLFSEAWDLYKQKWPVLVEIILLPTLVTMLGYVVMSIGLGSPFVIMGGVIVLIGWIAFAFSILPVIFSIHHATGVDASYKATIGWFWPFVWLVLLDMFAVAGGFFILVIPGIWLAFSFITVTYVFVIEQRRGIDVLRQSKDYIKGYWWAVAGRALLLALMFMVATVIIEIPVMILAGNAARVLTTIVMTLFFVPFSAIYQYVIFKNLRELKPALAGEQTKERTGFIKACAIIGVVVFVLIVVVSIALVKTGMVHLIRADRYAPSPGYPMQFPPQQ